MAWNICLFVQQTDTCMHTAIDAFNCHFVFLRSSLFGSSEICARCSTIDQGKHHASSQALRTQKIFLCRCLAIIILYAKSRSNDRLTRNSQPPPTKQTLSLSGVTSSRAPPPPPPPRKAVLVGCCSWKTVSSAYPPCNSSQVSFFYHCTDFLTPCRNEVLATLRRFPCLEHKRQCIRLLLPLVESS